MRTVKWNAFLSGLCGFALILGVVVGSAHADVTVEKGSSILVFPKVRADGTFDTIIQLTNTGNSMAHAHCFYVNAQLFSTFTNLPCTVPTSTCRPEWQETDFTIWLTKQQPTHWLVGTGRQVNPFDGFGRDGSGFDPGLVPPETDFIGELKCVEVSESGEPITGNHLKGEATLIAVTTEVVLADSHVTIPVQLGDVAKYNAVGIQGNPDAQPSNPLLLDGAVYNACPEKLLLNFSSTASDDPVADEFGVDSTVFSELTLVPCSEDFENQAPTSTTLQFLVFNEFEERFSASTTVTCFLNLEITGVDNLTSFERSVFSENALGSSVAYAEITPVPDNDGNRRGVVGVVQRFVGLFDVGKQPTSDRGSSSANNIHTIGSLLPPEGGTPDQIRLIDLEF